MPMWFQCCSVCGSAADRVSVHQVPASSSDSSPRGSKRKGTGSKSKQGSKESLGLGAKHEVTKPVSPDVTASQVAGKPDQAQTQVKPDKDGLMPFQKKMKRRSSMVNVLTAGADEIASPEPTSPELIQNPVFGKRSSVKTLQQHLQASQVASAEGVPVTKANAQIKMKVVRGKDWKWQDEDGAPGKTGTVIGKDEATGTLTVYWDATNQMLDHYRYLAASDLAAAPASAAAASEAARASRVSQRNGSLRRNSQLEFNRSNQTVIIFDWDDTLFPTTYIREDLELSWKVPLQRQKGFSAKVLADIESKMQTLADNVIKLLEMANEQGHVVLVTLARDPWVNTSCKNFFPSVGSLIEKLGLPIVYAQEGQQIEYNKVQMMEDDEMEKFWAKVKGKAIKRELEKFYSQYEGQSWKNIISIGDSDFERLGTIAATSDYVKESLQLKDLEGESRVSVEGERNGHFIKVRTKTFKMIDQPEVEELTVEVELLSKWLPLMVNLDNGFDVNLEELDDPTLVEEIEATLKGEDA